MIFYIIIVSFLLLIGSGLLPFGINVGTLASLANVEAWLLISDLLQSLPFIQSELLRLLLLNDLLNSLFIFLSVLLGCSVLVNGDVSFLSLLDY